MVTRRLLHFFWRFFAGALALTALYAYGADSQQRTVRIGLVHPQSPSTASGGIGAFRERMRELGYVEGENLVIEARWAEGHYDRFPALMSEVLARQVEVLITYGAQGAVAAKKATSTVPIVGVAMGEPLRTGIVTSLAQPEGNLTGLSVGWSEGIAGKWLELLQETVPRLSTVAVIGNPDNPLYKELIAELQGIAPKRNLKVQLIDVREPGALNRSFEEARRKAQAVLVLPDSVFSANRRQLTAIAAKHQMPAMYAIRDFVDVGGLMAYAPDYHAQWYRAADFVHKILKGAKPTELPIEQPTQFQLAVNLKTARALGLKIPQSILLRADVIQ